VRVRGMNLPLPAAVTGKIFPIVRTEFPLLFRWFAGYDAPAVHAL
jgi:hypothetical protein